MNLDPSTIKTAILINLKKFMIEKNDAINKSKDLKTAASIYREIANRLDNVYEQIQTIDNKEKE